jgi:uncharacterized protein (TIGR00251 family)
MVRAASPDGTLLEIRVQARAHRDEVVGWQGRVLRMRVTAPPHGGQANQAVIDLLARSLDVPRSSLALVSGAASRDKRVRVSGCSLEDVRARVGRAGP